MNGRGLPFIAALPNRVPLLADTQHMEMVQLLYLSRAKRELTMPAILEIHRGARARNTRDNLTGLLLYGGGNFLQLLEGSPDKVDATFARICRDPRHDDVRILLRQSADRRIFPNWSMGLQVIDDRSPLETKALQEILEQSLAQTPGSAAPSRNMRILNYIKSFRARMEVAA